MIKGKDLYIIIVLTGLISSTVIFDSTIPNHLVSFKEIWVGLIISFLLISSIIFLKSRDLYINLLDLLIVFYLFFSITNDALHLNMSLYSLFKVLLPLCLIFAYLYLKYIFTRNNKFTIISIPIIAFFLVQLALGIAQYFGFCRSFSDTFPITGLFFNPAPYIIFTGSLGSFLIPYYFYKFKNRSFSERLFTSLISVLFISILIISNSRASWIAFSLVICYNVLFRYINVIKGFYNKHSILFSSIFGIGFIALIVLSFIIVNYKKGSALGRVFIWKNCKEIILNNLFTGVSHEKFDVAYHSMQALYFKNNLNSPYKNLAGDIRFAFNDYIQIFCENGIVGFSLFISIFILIICIIIKVNHHSKNDFLLLSCIYFLMYICVASLFSYPLQIIEIKVFFWTLIALLSARFEIYFPKMILYNINKTKFHILSFKLLCSIFGVGLALVTISKYSAFNEFNKTKTSFSKYGYEDLAKLNRLRTYIGDDPTFTIHLANAYIDNNYYEKGIVILEEGIKSVPERQFYYQLAYLYEKNRSFSLAESKIQYIIDCYPNLLYPRFLLALHYFNTGQQSLWIKQANDVLAFKPKINSAQIEEMKSKIYTMKSSVTE